MQKELKLCDLEGMSIQAEMTDAEVCINNAFKLIEAILAKVEDYPPKTQEGEDGIATLQDFYDITLREFSRAESTMWKIEES